MPGQSYTVGERGSEEFVSAVPGYIVPHGVGGGGGETTIVHVHVGGSVVTEGQLIERIYTGLLRKKRNQPGLGLS